MDILEKVEVMVASRVYTMGIVINFITEQAPHFNGLSQEPQGGQDDMDDEEWEFWFGSGGRSPNGTWCYHQQSLEDSQTATQKRRKKC